MNVVTNNSLNEQLQGLLFPPETTALSWEVILALLLISFSAIALTIWLYQKHSKRPAIIAIKQLNKLRPSSYSDSQSVALEITQILRQGLEVTRLDSYHPAERQHRQQHKQEWDTYKSLLDKACYSTDTKLSNMTSSELQHLIEESKNWLLQANQQSSESQ